MCVLVQTATPKWLVVTTLGGHTLGQYSARMHNIDTDPDTSYMFVYDCDACLHCISWQFSPHLSDWLYAFFFFCIWFVTDPMPEMMYRLGRRIVCKKGNRVSGAPRWIKGEESSEISDLLQLVLMYGHLYWWMRPRAEMSWSGNRAPLLQRMFNGCRYDARCRSVLFWIPFLGSVLTSFLSSRMG